jgi:hypothetical protein
VTRLTSSPLAERNAAEPRVLWTPPSSVSSAGAEAVDLAASVGLILDPWQRQVLEHGLAEDANGKWSAFEVGICVPRQNGKSAIIEARILAGLFLFDEELIVYSAHLYDTATEVLRRLESLIDGTAWMRKRVKLSRVGEVAHWSHGNEGIELQSGHRVRFKTRTKGGGRGLAADCVILDEAMVLTGDHTSALIPTMAAKSVTGNPQMWYAGSAGNPTSVVFGGVRDRAMQRTDPSLCWLEWSVDESAYATALRRGSDATGAFEVDPVHIEQANPGLNVRITLQHCLREQRSMWVTPLVYARERLGVGQWPTEAGAAGPISREQWAALADESSEALNPVVFAIAVSLDGSMAAIGLAGNREDGLSHVEISGTDAVTDHRPGVYWVAERAAELRDKHKPSAFVLDAGTRANSLVPDLIKAGFVVHSGKGSPAPGSLVLLGGSDVTGAYGDFVSDATAVEPTLRHRPNAGLDAAIRQATSRHVGQALAWDGRGFADISPLVAVTLARWGFVKFGRKKVNLMNTVW